MDFYRHFEKARPDAPLSNWFEAHHPSAYAAALEASARDGAWAVEADDALRPSEREMRENSRSRSAILHVLRRRDGAARTADLERGAYAARGWSAPPRAPDPPATTFEYEAVGASASAGRTDDGENVSGRTASKEKKAKKEKKRGSKWAEA
jgi:16S rRNA (cytosine1402-N4)-methyltransferase